MIAMVLTSKFRPLVLCGLMFGELTWPDVAVAHDCVEPQIYSLPEMDGPRPLPAGASLWVMADDVHDDFGQRDCRFVANGSSGDVDGELVLHPDSAATADSAGDGCAVSGTRFSVIAELIPQSPVTAGEEYAVVCGRDDDERIWSHTWVATNEQPPTFDDLDLVLVEKRRYEDRCWGDRYLQLSFQPVEDRFFVSGGLFLVEYATDRIDVIRGVEQHAAVSVAVVDLPLPEDVTFVIRAINGMGDEVGAWTVDVAGLGEEGEGGCRSSGVVPREVVTLLLLLFVVGPRRRRRPVG